MGFFILGHPASRDNKKGGEGDGGRHADVALVNDYLGSNGGNATLIPVDPSKYPKSIISDLSW
jgi:hypothetical protein